MKYDPFGRRLNATSSRSGSYFFDQIDYSYPDFQSIVGSGNKSDLITIDPRFLRDLPITQTVTVLRARDDIHAPLVLTDDGTRHVIMPMVESESTDWKRGEEAAAKAAFAFATDVELKPTPVTPAESAYRTRDAANERRAVTRAERLAAQPPLPRSPLGPKHIAARAESRFLTTDAGDSLNCSRPPPPLTRLKEAQPWRSRASRPSFAHSPPHAGAAACRSCRRIQPSRRLDPRCNCRASC